MSVRAVGVRQSLSELAIQSHGGAVLSARAEFSRWIGRTIPIGGSFVWICAIRPTRRAVRALNLKGALMQRNNPALLPQAGAGRDVPGICGHG